MKISRLEGLSGIAKKLRGALERAEMRKPKAGGAKMQFCKIWPMGIDQQVAGRQFRPIQPLGWLEGLLGMPFGKGLREQWPLGWLDFKKIRQRFRPNDGVACKWALWPREAASRSI